MKSTPFRRSKRPDRHGPWAIEPGMPARLDTGFHIPNHLENPLVRESGLKRSVDSECDAFLAILVGRYLSFPPATPNSGGSGQPNGLALSTANLYSARCNPAAVFSACRKVIRSIPKWHMVDPRQTTAQRKIQWLETRLVGLTFSAEGSRYTAPAKKS